MGLPVWDGCGSLHGVPVCGVGVPAGSPVGGPTRSLCGGWGALVEGPWGRGARGPSGGALVVPAGRAHRSSPAGPPVPVPAAPHGACL